MILQMNSILRSAVRAGILAITLSDTILRGNLHAQGQDTTTPSRETRLLLDEGVTLAPRSRVSVYGTAADLHVKVLEGEVLVRPPEGAHHALIVTAGAARLSEIEATVCVGVKGDRTVVAVLDGAVELSVLSRDGQPPQTQGIALRGGDLLELRRVSRAVMFRFAGSTPMGAAQCEGGALLSGFGLVVNAVMPATQASAVR